MRFGFGPVGCRSCLGVGGSAEEPFGCAEVLAVEGNGLEVNAGVRCSSTPTWRDGDTVGDLTGLAEA